MFFLILLLLTGIAQADVYVMTDQNNNVVALSSQNNAVVPPGDIVTDLPGTVAQLPITGDPTMYTFSGNTFTINASKIQAQQAQQTAAIAQQTATANAKASAIAKLTDAISKVATQDVLTQQELQSLLPGS